MAQTSNLRASPRLGKRKPEDPPSATTTVKSPKDKVAKTETSEEAKTEIKLDGFNINFALIKAEEVKSFRELKDHPVGTLQGIGPKYAGELEKLGLKTIQQMADYKFYHLAKCIKTLAQTEETGNRLESSKMNLESGLIKEFEPYALKDLLEQPIHALQGLSPAADKTFDALGVKTIEQFADFKYFHWAEAIVTAAKWEL
ncbi:unnamed protein product [Cylindrotheca closterium]|uniref:Uncharacterized protein n=1 Tax=Cylindrotheca closterium TaxID=2856 RepID=A0AAD2CSI9_9STRA|nr:unnamed protein product [Cylindrotheca closterium]